MKPLVGRRDSYPLELVWQTQRMCELHAQLCKQPDTSCAFRSLSYAQTFCHTPSLVYTAPPLSYGYWLGAAGPDFELERPLETSHARPCWGEFLGASAKGAAVSSCVASVGWVS